MLFPLVTNYPLLIFVNIGLLYDTHCNMKLLLSTLQNDVTEKHGEKHNVIQMIAGQSLL